MRILANNNSNFFQAIWIAFSQGTRIVLSFLSAIILSRYLTKDDYGTFKQVIYVYITLSVLFEAGLSSVFPYFIPRYKYGEGKFIVNKVTNILFLLGALFTIFLYSTSDIISDLMKNKELAIAIKMFSLTPLFLLPTLGIEGLYIALKKSQYIVIYQTITLLISLICCTIPVIFFDMGYKGAIIGWVVGSGFKCIIAVLMKQLPYTNTIAIKVPFIYKQVFSYALPLMLVSIAGLFLHSASQFFISRYCGQVSFAEFSNGFISLPFVSICAGSVRSLLLPICSKANTDGTIQNALKVYENAVWETILLVFPIIFFCFTFAKDIMTIMYTDNYISSTPFFQLALLKDLLCGCIPFLAILLGVGALKFYVYIHFFSTILIWTINYFIVKYLKFTAVDFSAVYVFVSVLNTILLMSYIILRLKIRLFSFDLAMNILKVLLHLSIVSLICYNIYNILPKSPSLIFNVSIIGVIFLLITIATGYILNLPYYINLLQKFYCKQ